VAVLDDVADQLTGDQRDVEDLVARGPLSTQGVGDETARGARGGGHRLELQELTNRRVAAHLGRPATSSLIPARRANETFSARFGEKAWSSPAAHRPSSQKNHRPGPA